MAEKNYAKYIKKLKFEERGQGFYRQVATINGKEFDVDFNIEYGKYIAPGPMGNGKIEAHKHDYNQVLFFLGADPEDMSELNAEVELSMGEEMEKMSIYNSSTIAIPAGTPHFPSTVMHMKKRFMYMEISQSNELKETPVPVDEKAFKEKQQQPLFGSKYWGYKTTAGWSKKGIGYGPINRDNHGGHIAYITNQNPEMFPYLIMCESMKQAPYRFGWDTENPHAHSQPEILNFVSTDLNDLNNLGGEVEIYLGKKSEMEHYVFDYPVSIVLPAGVAHNPLTITRVDRPFMLIDVRPFGMEMKAGKM